MSRVFTRFFFWISHENGLKNSPLLWPDRGCLHCFSLGRLGGGRCGYLGEVVTWSSNYPRGGKSVDLLRTDFSKGEVLLKFQEIFVSLTHLSNEKKPSCVRYLRDYTAVSNYVGIIINHCKDPFIKQSILHGKHGIFLSWLTWKRLSPGHSRNKPDSKPYFIVISGIWEVSIPSTWTYGHSQILILQIEGYPPFPRNMALLADPIYSWKSDSWYCFPLLVCHISCNRGWYWMIWYSGRFLSTWQTGHGIPSLWTNISTYPIQRQLGRWVSFPIGGTC